MAENEILVLGEFRKVYGDSVFKRFLETPQIFCIELYYTNRTAPDSIKFNSLSNAVIEDLYKSKILLEQFRKNINNLYCLYRFVDNRVLSLYALNSFNSHVIRVYSFAPAIRQYYEKDVIKNVIDKSVPFFDYFCEFELSHKRYTVKEDFYNYVVKCILEDDFNYLKGDSYLYRREALQYILK